MLNEVTPAKEVTGGPWYSDDQEFDYAFVSALGDFIVQLISQHGMLDLAAISEKVIHTLFYYGPKREMPTIAARNACNALPSSSYLLSDFCSFTLHLPSLLPPHILFSSVYLSLNLSV